MCYVTGGVVVGFFFLYWLIGRAASGISSAAEHPSAEGMQKCVKSRPCFRNRLCLISENELCWLINNGYIGVQYFKSGNRTAFIPLLKILLKCYVNRHMRYIAEINYEIKFLSMARRGVTNPVFAGSGSGTTTKGVGVGVTWIRIFAGIGSTHGIGSFWGLHISNTVQPACKVSVLSHEN